MLKFKPYIITRLFLTLLFVFFSLGTFAQTTPTQTQEMIFAIWADARGSILINHSCSVQMINKLKAAHFNTVFLQVRHDGDAYYISASEPRAAVIDPDYIDPLADVISISHSIKKEETISVHPWFTILRAFTANVYPTPPAGNVMSLHPEWLSEDVSGNKMDENKSYYLDPGVPAVHDYLTRVVLEVIQAYDVDGIHLEGLSYPQRGINWGYNPIAVARFNEENNYSGKPLPDDPVWCQWRRDQITSLVERISKTVKEAKPEIAVSVAVGTNGYAPASKEEFKNCRAYNEYLQDWLKWADSGFVDIVCLKAFFDQPSERDKFESWVNFALANKGKARICIGVAGEINFTDQVVQQMRFVRSSGLADGIALWSYRKPTKDDPDVMFKVLGTTVFTKEYFEIRKPRVPRYVPPAPLMVEERITTPGLAVEVKPTTPTLEIAVLIEEVVTTPVVEVSPVEVTEIITPPQVPVGEEIEAPGEPTPSPTPLISIPPPPEMKWDTIYLVNGNSFEGKIIDEVAGKAIIETSAGLKMIIPIDNIKKIVRVIK